MNQHGEMHAMVSVKAANNRLDGNTEQQDTVFETSRSTGGAAGVAEQAHVYDTSPVVIDWIHHKLKNFIGPLRLSFSVKLTQSFPALAKFTISLAFDLLSVGFYGNTIVNELANFITSFVAENKPKYSLLLE